MAEARAIAVLSKYIINDEAHGPYIKQRAVIQEVHRIGAVITTRLIRIAPNESLRYKEWEIPAGVSLSARSSWIGKRFSLLT